MNKIIFIALILIPYAYAVEISANPDYVLETQDEFILDTNGKILSMDKNSVIGIDAKITDEGFEIEGVKIKQLANKTTYVYFGKPNEEILKSDKSIAYIVEHYYPDLELTNPLRLEGFRRLTVVIKNADLEIKNGLVIETESMKIRKDSLFESSEDKEIDIIKENKLYEIYVQAKELVIKTFDSFSFNKNLDRGYSGNYNDLDTKTTDTETINTEGYYDVLEGEIV